MYEKPQYLTPDGFRRAKQNPFKTGLPLKEAADKLAKAGKTSDSASHKKPQSQTKKNLSPSKPYIEEYLRRKQGGNIQKTHSQDISEAAARLIAEAIKSMLNSK